MTARGQRAVGRRRVWVRDLAAAAHRQYPTAPRDAPRALAVFLAACPPLRLALARAAAAGEAPPAVQRWYDAPTSMGVARWPVARLDTVGDLAALVGMRPTQLRWTADVASLERTVADERLRHYRYRWVPKAQGGGRLIEAPKPVLRHVQRVILREVLAHVPAHPVAHGFRRGRSTLTYASAHVGREVVIHLDLEDYFSSVGAGRVWGIFRQCGYPEPVAHVLTALCTNAVPPAVRSAAPPGTRRSLRSLLVHPHLPQGAPTSPALANLVTFAFDRRLAALGVAAGLSVSRYADDIALSSARRRSGAEVTRTIDSVRAMAAAEGFVLNDRKTAVRRSGQHQRLAGIVVNQVPNVDRRDYDRLEATLVNAVRHGPASQNRADVADFRAHLLGRISWVAHLNPRRGEQLRAVWDRIDWDRSA